MERSPRGGGRDLVVSQQIADRLGQVTDTDGLDSGQRRLRRRVDRTDHPTQPGTCGALRGGDRAGHGPYATVEPELADAGVLHEPCGRNLAEAARIVSAIARSKPVPSLRSDAGARLTVIARFGQVEERRVDAAPHPMLRLLAGTVGEPDDGERRQVGRAQVGFDLDAARLEADERERDRAAQHTSTLRTNLSRKRAAFVPEV